MPNPDSTITAQTNFSSIIRSTQADPNLSPHARVGALKKLLRSCTLSINACHSAYTTALRRIFECKRYKESLEAMTDISQEELYVWTSMTDRDAEESHREIEQIRSELNTLNESKRQIMEAVEQAEKVLKSM